MTRVIHIVMIMLIALVAVCAVSTAGQSAEIVELEVLNAQGDPVYTLLGPRDSLQVMVTVKGRRESCYVGATLIDSDGRELDFGARYCSIGTNALGGPTRETVTLISDELSSVFPGYSSRLTLVVRLWRKQVFWKDCDRIDPSDGETPCEYCRRNTYHMEDPIGSSWQETFNYLVRPSL